MIDLWLALVDQTFGGTNLYIPTILMMLAIGIICFTNKNWLQMPRYMLGTVISEIAGVYFFSVLGFGMQVLCRETKPEAKEFLKSSVWNLVSDSWNYDYTGVSLHTYLLDHAQGIESKLLVCATGEL